MTETKQEENKQITNNKNYISYAIIGILIFLLILSIFTQGFSSFTTSNFASSKALNFINTYMLPSGIKATLENAKEESGLIALNISIEGKEYKIYITKDGKYLFLQPINIDSAIEEINKMNSQSNVEFSPKKTEKPTIKFFVMSFCPYGQQAENSLKVVYDLFKNKINFEPHYVIYNYGRNDPNYCIANGTLCSMHGINELNEDIRQICIYKLYGIEKFWNYVNMINSGCNLQNIETCWKEKANALNISISEIEKCKTEQGEALIKEEYELNQKYNVQGSPTVFINDEQYSGSRSPEAYKTAVCTGFLTMPTECNQKLSSSVSQTSGSCG
ncbi:MAG: thioredoxin domain-containing protein [Candidatus Aenigmatarchaeota archaeon]